MADFEKEIASMAALYNERVLSAERIKKELSQHDAVAQKRIMRFVNDRLMTDGIRPRKFRAKEATA